MTTILNQVTCSVCNMKLDDIKRKEHLISTNHLNLSENTNDKTAKKLFELIFNACPKKNKINNLKNAKTCDFWKLYFSRKLPKEKLDILCSDSINKSELENNFSSDFQIFKQNVTADIGEIYFNLVDKIMFCKICSIEINKSLVYDHITSKQHRDIENMCFNEMNDLL